MKKTPKHGDTMAMKALILNSMGKTTEAFELGKEALKADMKSHVCWHVYGLLWRSAKNFDEAIKAYKFALRLDPESAQIQRDLAMLQIQIRDYKGYIASRKAMMTARPHIRQNWTALAVAHHLAGELEEAESVLTKFEESLDDKQKPGKMDFENSEATIYKNTIIAERGDYERALEHLETDCKHNLDRLAVMQLRAEYLTKLGRKEEAAAAYRALIDRNSEHTKYYTALADVMDVAEDDHKARKSIYDEYAEKYPRSDAARRLPLDFLTGEEFRTAAEAYVHRMLNKGVPSTFANLKHLYSDESKKQAILKIVEEYISNKKGETNGEPKREGDTSKGDSSAFYFLAQHYNYHLSRDLNKAMEYIEKAIELEPKSVDFTMTKARIFKHKGELKKASETMEQARKMDLGDRYINTKSAKYMLRNDENEAALKTLGMFTRQETVGGPIADLIDMQCMWYMTEDGQSHSRQGNVGLALKRFHTVYQFFETWTEDQFDFHTFSLRKGLIRAYVEMVRWEDHLRDHPFFTRAALSAIKEYIKLANKPASNGTAEEDAAAALEKKKAAKKARKEAERLAEEEKKRKDAANKTVPAGGEVVKKVDEDPNGEKLAETKTPLEDSLKFLTPVLKFAPKLLEGQVLGAEVFAGLGMCTRSEADDRMDGANDFAGKFDKAAECLIAAKEIDAADSTVAAQIEKVKKAFEEKSSTLDEKSLAAAKEKMQSL